MPYSYEFPRPADGRIGEVPGKRMPPGAGRPAKLYALVREIRA